MEFKKNACDVDYRWDLGIAINTKSKRQHRSTPINVLRDGPRRELMF